MSRKDKILNGNALYTFIAIIIGFVAGAVLLAVAGINPGLAYGKLLNGVFGQVKYITWSIVYAAPLILTGLSVAFSFRTGVFNIGAEGQFVVAPLQPVPLVSFLIFRRPFISFSVLQQQWQRGQSGASLSVF